MSTAAEEAGIGMLVLLAGILITCIGTISLARSLSFIFSSRDGRLRRILQIFRLSARRTFLAAAIVAAIGYSWSYCNSAYLRSICTEPDRNSEWSADGIYLARYCDFGDTIVLRLYDRHGQRLVAERTYRDTSGVPVRLFWKNGVLNYAEDYDQGAISLPPSLYDRLLAKLP